MRISDKKTTSLSKINWQKAALIGFLVLLVGLLVLFLPEGVPEGEVFTADMERLTGNNFKASKGIFYNGQTQSRDKAKSGLYSAKCDDKQIYGPSIEFADVNAGDIFEASVWRQSEDGMGSLVFAGDGWDFYKHTSEMQERKGGWDFLKLRIRIPNGISKQKLKCYVYRNSKTGTVYFDDFSIIRNAPPASFSSTTQFKAQKLNLMVEDKELERLQTKRIQAFSLGNLLTSSADFVQAKLTSESGDVAVKARLKGDLLDHLQGKKWSFRILPKKGESWNNMREFSVHNAYSRAFLDEWMFHQALIREDIMTTRYDFIEFSLNDESLGIYAYEEHFAYPILNNHERLPGPILRISEDGLWTNTQKRLKSDQLHWYESAQIAPYESKEVQKSSKKAELYAQGQNLLYSFRMGDKKAAEVFDLNQFAKFIALVDLCIGYHAINSTNLRFYFNPATARLEPIGYDGYSTDGTKFWGVPNIMGMETNSSVPKLEFVKENRHFFFHLFNDMEFMALYGHYLEKYSAPTYLQTFQDSIYSEVSARAQFIQQEYTDYSFDLDHYFRNGPAIRNILFPIPEVSLKAHFKDRSSSSSTLTLESYHVLPLEILGAGNNGMEHTFNEPLILEAYHPNYPPIRKEWTMPGKWKNLYFKTLGTDSISSIPIFRWPAPELIATPKPQSIKDLKKLDFLTIEDQLIQFKTGKHTLRSDLRIPAGYVVKMVAGTTINLKSGVSIISQSPIFAIGSADIPIVFVSEDRLGGGLAVLQTKEKSVFKNVVFNQLNGMQNSGQIIDGAVYFYEADADFSNCYFKNIKSKDALGFSRCKYLVENSFFEACSGDGMDANFAIGVVTNCKFDRIGKDGIEVTGGRLNANDIHIKSSLGSGLNANLKAAVILQKMEIEQSEIGISSIDQAQITIDHLSLKEVEQGLVIYKKLAEYDMGKITVKDYTVEEVKKLYNLAAGAELLLKGNKITL